jgi:flagellar L-ring protein precursor FlgH
MRIWILALIIFLSGCASLGQRWKAFINGGDQPTNNADTAPTKEVTYSQQSNMDPGEKRQYHRVTKETLQQDSHLDDHSGSLWTMEGQGAYLFAQNTVRLIGDPIPVALDGDPRAQVETKATVIKKLMDRIEARQKEQLERRLAEENAPDAQNAPAAAPAAEAEPAKPKPDAAKDKKDDDKLDLKVTTVPSRIVERTVDGNYRIKGSQDFMIGSRDYRVIVTGIVRAEDFSEDGVSATKLLDPKFDVVSAQDKGVIR